MMKRLLFLLFISLLPAVSYAAQPKVVMAHYFVPMSYTNPTQNFGQEIRVGDINSAMEMGIDGFLFDTVNYSQANGFLQTFIAAADSLGASNFKVALALDGTVATDFTAQNVIDLIKTYGNNPHYLKYNGKIVLSIMGIYAQSLGNDWWKNNVLQPLATAGYSVMFLPLLDFLPNKNVVSPTVANWSALFDRYPVADGLLNFQPAEAVPYNAATFYGKGDSTTQCAAGDTACVTAVGNQVKFSGLVFDGLTQEENLATAVHNRGKVLFAPYMPYYWNSCNGTRPFFTHKAGFGMYNWWNSIINKQKADMVDIITWNDYSESTYVQPTRVPKTKDANIVSYPHLAYYELLKYYISWYKTGKQPTITKDGMFVFYRTQKNGDSLTKTSACAPGPVSNTQKWGNVEDKVYITTVLTAPAQLIVTSGTQKTYLNLQAGVTNSAVPYQPGAQSFVLVRNKATYAGLTGMDVASKPSYENFNVYSAYKIVGGDDSTHWSPSTRWQSGYVANWFQ